MTGLRSGRGGRTAAYRELLPMAYERVDGCRQWSWLGFPNVPLPMGAASSQMCSSQICPFPCVPPLHVCCCALTRPLPLNYVKVKLERGDHHDVEDVRGTISFNLEGEEGEDADAVAAEQDARFLLDCSRRLSTFKTHLQAPLECLRSECRLPFLTHRPSCLTHVHRQLLCGVCSASPAGLRR